MSADSGCYDGESRLSSHITDHSATNTDDDDTESVVRSEDGGHEMEYQPEDAREYAPEITLNLDDLNKFATKTNQLECCYDEENKRFQKILQESAVELKKLIKKYGEKSVIEARPYYDALNRRKELQIKCLLATREYEKCNDQCIEAKDAIRLTEKIFQKELEDRSAPRKDNFDQYWQEKLNLANQKFSEAKIKKEQHEREHMEVMFEFRDLDTHISTLNKKHKFCIKRTKPYFDTAQAYDQRLKSIRNDIQKLEEEIQSSKNSYSKALKNLESISEEIHEKRAQEITKFEREPGVGAEETASVETISFASEFDSKCSIQTFSADDED